jgi:acyl carrier protein
MMSAIKTKLRSYILENFIMGGDGPAFADGDSFMELHVIDSTGFLELVTFLEETWGFVVEDAEMTPENLDSLDGIEAYVTSKAVAMPCAA